MRRSRLNKNTEKRTKNTIILSFIGIVLILIILFKFGIDFLVNFSLFFSGSKNTGFVSGQNNKINFINTPSLNQLPLATNSAQIIIAGQSIKDAKIFLYINDKQIDDSITDQHGTFIFNENLTLGENKIKVRAEINDKKSNFSETSYVLYKNSQPTLEISSPTDGANFKKDQNNVNVVGKTDPGVNITINGFSAIIDYNNNFSYNLPLQNGDNQITIVAIDQAGNKSEKSLKITYSQ